MTAGLNVPSPLPRRTPSDSARSRGPKRSATFGAAIADYEVRIAVAIDIVDGD